MQRLRVGFAGVGRLGSAILDGLLKAHGVSAITLVDPDVVARHNCGEGGFYCEADIGQSKVEAWRRHLAATQPLLDVITVPRSVSHADALEALAECSLIVSAPDQSGARLAAGAVAALDGRMLLDVGVLIPRDTPSAMGLDVRLISPEACLLCCGGVADETLGMDLLASPNREQEFQLQREWRQERAGSLYSLNALAAAVALAMLEQCAAANLPPGLVWCQGSFRDGVLTAAPRRVPSRGSFPCFCQLAGLGDAGYARVLEILRQRRVGP